MHCRLLLLLLSLSICFVQHSVAADVFKIYTVNYPLAYFAERIAGQHAEVVFPAPKGLDPAFWQPSIDIIGAYQQADLILLNGADYAQWIKKTSLPRARLVNTLKAFSEHYILLEQAQSHSHGPQGAHAHNRIAATTWLDFQQARMQAQAIADALIRKQAQAKPIFEKNFAALAQDLDHLDQQLKDLLSGQKQMPLLASHPVYQYLARRYQLDLHSLHWEPHEMPAQSEWIALQETLKQHPARWLLWEAEPLAQAVAKLSTLNIKSIVFAPCANTPEQGDWLSVMQTNIAALKVIYEKTNP